MMNDLTLSLMNRFKTANEERLSFEKNAAICNKGDPWLYINYCTLVEDTLCPVKEIFEKLNINFDEDSPHLLLRKAHFLQMDPVDSIDSRVYKVRLETIKAGERLCSAFELTLQNLLAIRCRILVRDHHLSKQVEELKMFSTCLHDFKERIEKDRLDAAHYFKHNTPSFT